MRRARYTRNIEMPEEWRARIAAAVAEPDAPSTPAAWLRQAVREKLDRISTAAEMKAIEERQAATLDRMLSAVVDLRKSVQTQIAFADALAKALLTYLPEPGPDALPAARQRAKELYGNLIRHAAEDVSNAAA